MQVRLALLFVALTIVRVTEAQTAPAPRVAAVDHYSVAVEDAYQWMEDPSAPELRAWIDAQNRETRSSIDAGRDFAAVRARLLELTKGRRRFPPIARGNVLFFAEGNPTAVADSTLQVVDSRSGKTRVLVGRLEGDEQPDLVRYASGAVFPSYDGRYVAFRTTRGASPWAVMRVVETRSGRILDDRLEGGYGSYATAAWSSDNRGFFYARFELDPAKSEVNQVRRNHRLYYHRLGEPQSRDRLVAEAPDAPTRRFFPAITDDAATLVVTTALGSDARTRTWIGKASGTTALTELLTGREQSLTFVGGSAAALYFAGSLDSREAVYLVEPATGRARPVVEPDGDTLLYANLVADRLIVVRNRVALPRITIHLLDGSQTRELLLPELTTVWGPGSGGIGFAGRAGDRYAYFLTNGLADPGTLYRLDPASGELTVWREPDERIDPSLFTAQQVFFRSYDGTRVPMLLAWRRDLDRSKPQPVWMYAYGALGWPAFPFYQPHIVSWMERGGIYALPGIRGGGEYGESWHQAGILENRANAIEDYLAAAEWLSDHSVTTREMLVANGGSISGALASEALVVRPDLFATAVIDIPVTDLLRYNRFTGAGMWVPEFGDPGDPKHALSLFRHSPYHLIRPGRCYPPTLVNAGQLDQTAVPSHAWKFVASLQHAQACGHRVFLNAMEGTGHTFGATPEQTAETDARRVIFAESAIRSRRAP